MANITMKSKVLEIKSIFKKTQAQGVKDLKVGDKIQLETHLQNTSGARGSLASVVTMINLQTGERVEKTQTIWKSVLDAFILEEVE